MPSLVTPTPSPPKDFKCQVIFNQECGRDLKYLRLALNHNRLSGQQEAFTARPGQFVMLSLPEAGFSFRRPFSIAQRPDDYQLDIFYKRLGRGTQLLWEMEPGQSLNVLGPLGNGFSEPEPQAPVLCIGGGIGIAPFYDLGSAYGHQSNLHCFYGVRTAADLGLQDELVKLFPGRFYTATDDGSAGLKGNVCNLLAQEASLVRKAKQAYICGPMKMMQAASKQLQKLNPSLSIEVSLEEHMPCGTGACTGCVIERTHHPLPSKTCVEGPVFPAQSIRWPGTKACQPINAGAECNE